MMRRIFSREAESLIASLRSLPEEMESGQDTGIKEIGSLIETCVEKYSIGKRTPEEEIMENWNRIVGEAFATRSRPERITASGQLVIQVPNPTLRREMIFHEGRILTALGSLPSCHHIHGIHFKGGA